MTPSVRDEKFNCFCQHLDFSFTDQCVSSAGGSFRCHAALVMQHIIPVSSLSVGVSLICTHTPVSSKQTCCISSLLTHLSGKCSSLISQLAHIF